MQQRLSLLLGVFMASLLPNGAAIAGEDASAAIAVETASNPRLATEEEQAQLVIALSAALANSELPVSLLSIPGCASAGTPAEPRTCVELDDAARHGAGVPDFQELWAWAASHQPPIRELPASIAPGTRLLDPRDPLQYEDSQIRVGWAIVSNDGRNAIVFGGSSSCVGAESYGFGFIRDEAGWKEAHKEPLELGYR